MSNFTRPRVNKQSKHTNTRDKMWNSTPARNNAPGRWKWRHSPLNNFSGGGGGGNWCPWIHSPKMLIATALWMRSLSNAIIRQVFAGSSHLTSETKVLTHVMSYLANLLRSIFCQCSCISLINLVKLLQAESVNKRAISESTDNCSTAWFNWPTSINCSIWQLKKFKTHHQQTFSLAILYEAVILWEVHVKVLGFSNERSQAISQKWAESNEVSYVSLISNHDIQNHNEQNEWCFLQLTQSSPKLSTKM